MRAAILALAAILAAASIAAAGADPHTGARGGAPTAPSLPGTLDSLYPPAADRPVYLLKMLELETAFSGIVVDLMEEDLGGARGLFEEFRARYREGFEEERLVTPGETYRYTIDMWATSYLLSPGDRLRIDVTSSNYPRLARNLNTGAAFAKTSEMKIARQTIHLGEDHPSQVVLPFIPR